MDLTEIDADVEIRGTLERGGWLLIQDITASLANYLTGKGAEDVLNHQFVFQVSNRNDTMYSIADSEKEKKN